MRKRIFYYYKLIPIPKPKPKQIKKMNTINNIIFLNLFFISNYFNSVYSFLFRKLCLELLDAENSNKDISKIVSKNTSIFQNQEFYVLDSYSVCSNFKIIKFAYANMCVHISAIEEGNKLFIEALNIQYFTDKMNETKRIEINNFLRQFTINEESITCKEDIINLIREQNNKNFSIKQINDTCISCKYQNWDLIYIIFDPCNKVVTGYEIMVDELLLTF